MIEAFVHLRLFFNDTQRAIHVREYARQNSVSAPTASTILTRYEDLGLLVKEDIAGRKEYRANRTPLFIHLSRAYWIMILDRIGMLDKLTSESILVGDFANANVTKDSIVEIATIGWDADLNAYSKKLTRPVHCTRHAPRERSKLLARGVLLNERTP